MTDPRSLTLGDVLREHRRSRPGKTATVDGDVRHTWPELDDRVNRLANALNADGFAAGDRILWLAQNSSRLLEALLATAKLGGICCPVNWRQSPEELTFVIDDVEAHTVLWQEAEIGDSVRVGRERASSSSRWVQLDSATDPNSDEYEALLGDASPTDPDLDVDPATPVLDVYTAAFEGRPNGALLDHTAIVTQSVLMAMLQGVDHEYRYLNCGPMFHVGTLMLTLATFQMGGVNVFTPRVDAEELCRLIDSERCTGAFLRPPTIAQIVEVNADRRYDLSSLRANPGPDAWNEMVTLDTSPRARHRGGYGQTEVMGLITFGALGPGTGNAGRPSPFAQVRIVDPEGNEVATGETGEIVVRGLTVMVGYDRRPELNDRRQRGGWHHTNDLGVREADGTIRFVGPMTRIVKSAAENIYPAEVEAALKRHDAVADAAIIGVPDEKWEQSVKAIIVLEDGRSVTAEDLIEHCRSTIASYKKPRTVEFVDALPKRGNETDYDALDAQFGGGGYPGGD
ncbi:MAG: AMP-binding protein [Acidimicrobiia bacterium]